MTHTFTAAVLAALLLLGLALLVAAVTCIEPGALERYLTGWAYHRHDARHARPRETTTLPALTTAEATA